MVSQSEYAAHRGVSRKTITVWKQRGLIVFNTDGTVNAAKTDAFIANHGGNITPLPLQAKVLPAVRAGARIAGTGADSADTEPKNQDLSAEFS